MDNIFLLELGYSSKESLRTAGGTGTGKGQFIVMLRVVRQTFLWEH